MILSHAGHDQIKSKLRTKNNNSKPIFPVKNKQTNKKISAFVRLCKKSPDCTTPGRLS